MSIACLIASFNNYVILLHVLAVYHSYVASNLLAAYTCSVDVPSLPQIQSYSIIGNTGCCLVQRVGPIIVHVVCEVHVYVQHKTSIRRLCQSLYSLADLRAHCPSPSRCRCGITHVPVIGVAITTRGWRRREGVACGTMSHSTRLTYRNIWCGHVRGGHLIQSTRVRVRWKGG